MNGESMLEPPSPQLSDFAGPGKAGNAPHLQTRDLALFYGRKAAFKDVSLEVRRGAITALIGPSGCGKTSFLNCLNRLTDLISDCRVEGRAWLGGTDILDAGLDVVALRRRVGMIFQKPNPFPFSVRRNFELPLREIGICERDVLEEAMGRALQDVGLWDEVKDRLDAAALSLSGGQQQRLCVARALALQPEVLLLDEPCSALDPIANGVVEDLMVSLAGRYTLLVVTHNLAQARRIAHEAAFFWYRDGAGHLIEQGPAKQIFESPQDPLTEAYIRGVRG